MPFKIVLFSGFALSYRRSPSYRSANQLPNRQVVLNAQGLRWTSHRNSAEYWNEQLRQSFLEGDTAKDRLESHTGLSGRGGGRLLSPWDWEAHEIIHLEINFHHVDYRPPMDRERKRTRETGRERLSFPLFIHVVFFFPLSLPKPFPQQSALATKRHLQSIMINRPHLTHLFP